MLTLFMAKDQMLNLNETFYTQEVKNFCEVFGVYLLCAQFSNHHLANGVPLSRLFNVRFIIFNSFPL